MLALPVGEDGDRSYLILGGFARGLAAPGTELDGRILFLLLCLPSSRDP